MGLTTYAGWSEMYDKLSDCCILEQISQKEKVYYTGCWVLLITEDLNLLKVSEIFVP